MSDGPGRKPTVSDEELLEFFREASDPILTTSDMATELSIGRRAVLDRLRNLEEQGIIESREVGSGSRVWWLPGHTTTKQK